MGLRVFLVACVLLGLSTGVPRPDFGAGNSDHHHEHHEEAVAAVPEKQCRLERAVTATSPECFLEPECRNNCEDKTEPVCTQVQEKECKTVKENVCNMVNEEKCENVKKTEYEKECRTTG